MLDSVNSNCHIPLSQAISLPLLPLHSLGNICIVYCRSDSIELGKSKQDVALGNYRSQGMMEEQTEAEVRRNSHYFFLLSPQSWRPLFRPLQLFFVLARLPALSLGPHTLLAVCGGYLLFWVAYFLVIVASAKSDSRYPVICKLLLIIIARNRINFWIFISTKWFVLQQKLIPKLRNQHK